MSKKGSTRTILGIHFLSLADVAQRLGIAERGVVEEIESGRLLAKKLGGSWHVAELWLDEYLTTPDVGPPTREDANAQIRRLIRTKYSRAVPPPEDAQPNSSDDEGTP